MVLPRPRDGQLAVAERGGVDRTTAQHIEGEPRHVDAGGHRQRHGARKARVDVQQLGRAVCVFTKLDVGDVGEIEARRDGAGERDEPLVADGAAGDGDAGVDLETRARHDGQRRGGAVGEHVHRILAAREQLLRDHAAVSRTIGERGEAVDAPHARAAGATPRFDDERRFPRIVREGGVDDASSWNGTDAAAGGDQRQLVGADIERPLVGQQQFDAARFEVGAAAREGQQLHVDGGDDDVHVRVGAASQHVVDETRIGAAKQQPATLGRYEVQPRGIRIDVAGEQLDARLGHRVHERHRGGSARARDENPHNDRSTFEAPTGDESRRSPRLKLDAARGVRRITTPIP